MKKIINIGSAFLCVFTLTACSNIDNRWNVSNSWCAKPVITVETIDLSTDLLFKFDGYSYDDILSEGQKELEQLAQSLKNGYISIDQITVTGHTDRIGSNEYNHHLGLERANTVRDYMLHFGINTNYITDSKGKNNPVITECSNSINSENLKACLQPNRRVVLEIHGNKNSVE